MTYSCRGVIWGKFGWCPDRPCRRNVQEVLTADSKGFKMTGHLTFSRD